VNAFTAAAIVLHADPNLGETATYFAKGQGPGVTIRVVRSAPDVDQSVFGQSIRTPTIALRVLKSDVDTLAQGDAFDLADRRVLVIDPKLDAEGTSWAAVCRDG
jgi:hypothetical protein